MLAVKENYINDASPTQNINYIESEGKYNRCLAVGRGRITQGSVACGPRGDHRRNVLTIPRERAHIWRGGRPCGKPATTAESGPGVAELHIALTTFGMCLGNLGGGGLFGCNMRNF